MPDPKLQQDLAAALQTWVDALSPHTRRAYERGLVQFADYLLETDILKPERTSPPSRSLAPMRRDAVADRTTLVGAAGRHLLSLPPGSANALVQAYIQHLSMVNESTGVPEFTRDTVKQRVSSLRWAVREARRRGLVTWQLDVVLPRPSKDPQTGRLQIKKGRNMRGPPPAALGQMLGLAAFRNDHSRWLLILSLIAHETLREHEICALDFGDIDHQKGLFSVVRKKDDFPVELPLSPPTDAALSAWLKARGDAPGALIWGSRNAVLRPGTRMSVSGVYYVVRTLGERCGVLTSPHKVRHTAITLGQRVRESLGIPLQDAMERAGHQHPDTHHKYLDKDLENVRRLNAGVARLLRGEDI